ncbi:unnamed protein product [Durusdinium trenchii]|uniref:EF-hand domain-containing protein n=1 Tax=Durusdinium trenchii TaxID=1381693 RepID=A0ABP0KQM7_9DINO
MAMAAEPMVKRNSNKPHKPRMSRRSTDGDLGDNRFYLKMDAAVGKTRSDAAQGPIALAMRRSERKDVLEQDGTSSLQLAPIEGGSRQSSHSRAQSHSRVGSKGRAGSKSKATALPFEEFRARRRHSGALGEYLASGQHMPSLGSNGSKSPTASPSSPGKALQRRATMPTLDVSSEALVLSRQLHLDFHEVKGAMKEIRDGRHLSNGGMDEVAWRFCMNRIFGMEVEDKFVKDSYKLCEVGEGPVDAKLFMTWYRDHIFNIEAKKPKLCEGDELTMELAKKHHCSYTDLTKVRLKFDSFDLDKSGVIDFLEFEHMIHKLLHCSTRSDLPPNRIARFWHEIDRDNNGTVDFQEFTDWYMKYFATAKQDGPIEAFYASFMPGFQRSHALEVMQENPAAKLDAKAIKAA